VNKNFIAADVPVSKQPLSYKDLARICREADPACLARASDFGTYAGSFQKLKDIVESMR
jgi:hypothetical protein